MRAAALLSIAAHFVAIVLVWNGSSWGFYFFGMGFLLTGAAALENHMNRHYPDQEEL